MGWIVYAIGDWGISGGMLLQMFLQVLVREPGQHASGPSVITFGGAALSGSALFLAWRLFRARDVFRLKRSLARNLVWTCRSREEEAQHG